MNLVIMDSVLTKWMATSVNVILSLRESIVANVSNLLDMANGKKVILAISTGLVWIYSVKRHFQKYFSNIVAVIFIGGGNQRIRRKLPTCRKSLTKFIA